MRTNICFWWQGKYSRYKGLDNSSHMWFIVRTYKKPTSNFSVLSIQSTHSISLFWSKIFIAYQYQSTIVSLHFNSLPLASTISWVVLLSLIERLEGNCSRVVNQLHTIRVQLFQPLPQFVAKPILTRARAHSFSPSLWLNFFLSVVPN